MKKGSLVSINGYVGSVVNAIDAELGVFTIRLAGESDIVTEREARRLDGCGDAFLSATARRIKDMIGEKSLFMLGAKNYLSDDESLSMMLGKTSNFEFLKIKENPDGTYALYFFNIIGGKCESEEYGQVLSESIIPLIEKKTGLSMYFPKGDDDVQ